MSQPSFVCPRCGYTTFLPSDIEHGYCAVCRWWTGDSLLGSDDVMRQNEIDGPLSLMHEHMESLESLEAHNTMWSRVVEYLQNEEQSLEPLFGTCYQCGGRRNSALLCETHPVTHAAVAREEVERDWFGADVHVAFDPSWHPATFRVARWMQALRRLRGVL